MINIIIKIIKFLIITNPLYKLYLKIPIKKDFQGTQDFSPINKNLRSLEVLIKINNNIFTNDKKNHVPMKMHSFEWLSEFKNSGGIELLKKSRELILDWDNRKYNLSSEVWSDILIARRMVNLLINYDFYGFSAEANFQKKIINIVNFHFKHLLFLNYFHIEKYEIDIEISKSLLLINKLLIKNNNLKKIITLIKKQITYQINNEGFHKSININEQAHFIHQLIEIKNILLFYKIEIWPELEDKINIMLSLLKNMFHKDQSLPLFNGTNNKNINYVKSINSLQKDLREKKLTNINNGLLIINANKTKVFFDLTKPTNKLLNKKLHSGTLSFEMSHDNEKIITNCGSPEKYLGKKQVFFRYSAAHSTLTINNTNIAELSEKDGYKRIPKNIKNNFEESELFFLVTGSHDGYNKNYNLFIKRILKISKNGESISGSDQILSLRNNNNRNNYEIRFHLMPDCDCIITNNDKKVIIKSKYGSAWFLETKNDKLSIEDSIYIGNGDYTIQTKQVIISGVANKIKYRINWNLYKIN